MLWVATADGGVSRFDGAHFDTFGLSDGFPHLTATAIAEDADGRLLFGTIGGGLAAYNGHHFRTYTTSHGRAAQGRHRGLATAAGWLGAGLGCWGAGLLGIGA